MEYTVQKLSRLAGVSTRTLRYYDQVGLLKPARKNSSGYRIYGQQEVGKLQQILFYRELGFSLEDIKHILEDPAFDRQMALEAHRRRLLDRRKQLDLLLQNVEKTLSEAKGEYTMADQEKFEGFKRKMIEENEAKYGKEIREKYGEDTVDRSNAKLSGLSEEGYEELKQVEQDLFEKLAEGMETGNPGGEAAQQAAALHKKWLTFHWDHYSKEAHAGLADMYVADERFKAYYDHDRPGTAEFLRMAIRIYTGMDKE